MEVIDKTIKKITKVTLTAEERAFLTKIIDAVDEFTLSGLDNMRDDANILDNLRDLAFFGFIEQECD